MGRITGALMTLTFIHIGLYLYTGSPLSDSAILSAMLQLEGWAENSFVNYLTDTVAIIGGGLIIALSGFVFRNEFPIYLGIAATFIGFGMGYFELYQRIRAEDLLASGESAIILSLFMIPVLLSWFIIILEFARGRD